MGGGSTVNMTLNNRAGHSYIVGHHIGDGSDVKVNKMEDGKKNGRRQSERQKKTSAAKHFC